MQTYFDIIPDDIYPIIFGLISKSDYINLNKVLNPGIIHRKDKQKKFLKWVVSKTEDYHIDVHGHKQGKYFKKSKGYTYKGFYVNGKREGTYLIYYLDELVFAYEYARGRKHGRFASYDGSNVTSTGNYHRDKLHGDYTIYDDNNVKMITPYRHGLKHGTVQGYYRKRFSTDVPRVRRTCDYIDGKRHGVECEYDGNEVIITQNFYKHDELHGECYTLDRQGCIMNTYDNGKLIEYKRYIEGVLKQRSVYTHCNDKHTNSITYDYSPQGLTIRKSKDNEDDTSYLRWIVIIGFVSLMFMIDTEYVPYILSGLIFTVIMISCL